MAFVCARVLIKQQQLYCVYCVLSLGCFADEASERAPLWPWAVSPHFCVTRLPGLQPHLPLTYAWGTMGSVSSLINGNSVTNKHCRASEYRLKKGANHHRKSGGCSLDGLLKCGFTQGSSSTAHPSKRLTHSGRSEDFFYIKVRSRIMFVRSLITTSLAQLVTNKTFILFDGRWAINQGQRTTEVDRWRTKATKMGKPRGVRSPDYWSCQGI